MGEAEGDEVEVSFAGEAMGEVVKVSPGEIVASLSIVSGGGFSVSCPFSLPVMIVPVSICVDAKDGCDGSSLEKCPLAPRVASRIIKMSKILMATTT